MRYTVVDERGTVSFVAECEALLPLVAACAKDPMTLDELLEYADEYAAGLREKVACSLAIFDEQNTPENHGAIHRGLEIVAPHQLPAFRVLGDRTRDASLTAVHAGVVIFNLAGKRIVQIQNSYAEIPRKGKARAARPTAPNRRVIRYELPAHWSLVPGQ